MCVRRGAVSDGTQKQSETDDSLVVFTSHEGLAITCNGLNRNCVMAPIPPERNIPYFALSPSHAKQSSAQIRVSEYVT